MDDGGSLIYGFGGLLLVISALVARRLPMSALFKMILSWTVIFALIFVVISYRFELKQVWSHLQADLAGTSNQQQIGKQVRLQRGDDGHFSAVLNVNGTAIPFLVDTGATMTSMSAKSAESARVVVDRSSYPVIVETANGTVKDWRAKLSLVSLENIALQDHSILISDSMADDQNLLGMNFLNELSSWRVEGDVMVLVPHELP
jgi:aspartyl protease family protein